MTLREWLAAKKLQQRQFAALSGVSEPTISRIIKGRTKASLGDALKIVDATKGKVTLRDLLAAAPERKAKSAAA